MTQNPNPTANPARPDTTNNYPATVIATLTTPCSAPERPTETHTILIHRNGTTTLHNHELTTHEQIITALGATPYTNCHTWQTIPTLLNNTPENQPLPHPFPTHEIPEWTLTTIGMWTHRAAWTALTGITSVITHAELDPELALAHTQTYAQHGTLPTEPIRHLTYLTQPWTRPTGWRTKTPTTPETLHNILNAGMPTERAATAAILGITSELITHAKPILTKYGLPIDTLNTLAYTTHPTNIPALLDALTNETGPVLPHRLNQLNAQLRNDEQNPHGPTVLTHADIHNYLTQPAPPIASVSANG